MPYNTNLCTTSKSLFVVVLLVNWLMFQLLKEPNTGHYVQTSTVWHHGYLVGALPMTRGLSNMVVQAIHVQGIRFVVHFPLPNLGSSLKL